MFTSSAWFRLAAMLQGEVQLIPLENSTLAPIGTVSTVRSCSVPRTIVAQPGNIIRNTRTRMIRMGPLRHGNEREAQKVAWAEPAPLASLNGEKRNTLAPNGHHKGHRR